mmetsp:Transcript_16386/g.29987  ORF Transcript_16386/g.29987 Transcript_16386/m.29987 type:complete len:260 (+) Transcript_16386:480-1259(+)
MPEIVELPSSDEEEEVAEKDTALQHSNEKPVEGDASASDQPSAQRTLEPTVVHPAACGAEVLALRSLDEIVNHPGSVRHIHKDIDQALALKDRGNELFKNRAYIEAVEFYSDALDNCPDEEEHNKSAAVFLSNRAACLLHLGRLDEVVEDCTEALELSPEYVKPLLRRAQALEQQDDMDGALADYTKLAELEPSNRHAVKERNRLDALVKEKNEKLKDEMMGKLKDLGNTVLGKFGFSLDNFKTVQDPETGSYSISFQQ